MEEKIKIIHIDQPFLRIFADYYFERFKEFNPDFSKTLIVFPSERNKFYFRRYLLNSAHAKGIIPPTMLTVEELTDYLYEKLGGEGASILHNIERNFILKKAIDDLKIKHWQDLPFLKFISIGDRLLNFYDELSQEQMNIEDVKQKSDELHFSERYVKNELPILERVYKKYRENLTEAGYRDRIDEFEAIYENYDSKILEEFDSILIAGIAATTSFEKFLLKRIISELPAELVIHSGGPEEIASSTNPNGKFHLHYKLLSDLDVDIRKVMVIGNHPSVKPVVHLKPLETITKQTFYLGDIVREAIKKYKELHRIGIVLTDESLLFPITEILRSYDIEYNLSAGIPFTNLIFYSFLKHLYDAINSNLHYSEFFIFLQHPLIKNASINNVELRPLVYGLRNKMVEKKIRNFQIEEQGDQIMIHGLEPGFLPLMNFLKRCFETVEQKLDFSDYIENLIKLLNDVLTYNQEIIKANFPGVREFFERLHNLAQLRIEHNAIPMGIDTLEFILRILQDGKYHVEGAPLKGIQIIGVLESRNLDFDCIILPLMNEGIFPRKSEKDMFINSALRKEMGLITEEERSNLYYYYFTQLTSGKKEVFISYIAEEKKDVPSRFIMMPESKGFIEDKEKIIFVRNVFTVKEHSANKNSQIIKELFKRFKGGLSYSVLKSYKGCPYQFYLKYLLRIEELDRIAEEFDALIWGLLFHNVAEEFYRKYFPNGLKKEQLDDATEKINKILDQRINSGGYVALPLKSIVHFDAELFKKYLQKFLMSEIERFEQGYMIFTESEEKKLNDSIEIDSYTIPLTGFVDRIDLKDGYYYIIDYKTGSLPDSKSYEIGEEFTEFQLPLYAMMFAKNYKEKIGGLVYYKIGKSIEIKEICSKNDVKDYLAEFRKKILIPVISEMIDIKVPFYQAKDKISCEYCAYNLFCGRK
ncbi:MAG: PD-(D/E)XK nuclease family protein [bacterium]